MKRKLFIAAAVGALLIGSAFFVTKLNASESGQRFGGGTILKRVIAQLNLSQEQISKIKTELRSEKDTIVPLLERLHTSRKQLRETIQSGADEKTIRAASAKVADVEADIAVERARLHSKIAPILNDDQIVKIKTFEEKADDFVINAIKAIGQKLEQN